MSWDLHLLFCPGFGRWDLGLTTVQQQHFSVGPSLNTVLSATRNPPVLLKGSSLQRAHPPGPPMLLCGHCDHSPMRHYWNGRDYFKSKNLLQFASGIQVPGMKNQRFGTRIWELSEKHQTWQQRPHPATHGLCLQALDTAEHWPHGQQCDWDVFVLWWSLIAFGVSQ